MLAWIVRWGKAKCLACKCPDCGAKAVCFVIKGNGYEKVENQGSEGRDYGTYEYSLCRFNPYQAVAHSRGGLVRASLCGTKLNLWLDGGLNVKRLGGRFFVLLLLSEKQKKQPHERLLSEEKETALRAFPDFRQAAWREKAVALDTQPERWGFDAFHLVDREIAEFIEAEIGDVAKAGVVFRVIGNGVPCACAARVEEFGDDHWVTGVALFADAGELFAKLLGNKCDFGFFHTILLCVYVDRRANTARIKGFWQGGIRRSIPCGNACVR